MKLYAVRKHAGEWDVATKEEPVLRFETYEQAIQTVTSAALNTQTDQHPPKPISPLGSHADEHPLTRLKTDELPERQ